MTKGFSIIEVMIALALLIATLVVFGVAVSSLPLTKNARDQNIAYHVAAKKIEELRKTAFSNLPSSGSFTDPALSNLINATADLTIVNYESSSQIKIVTVTVTWNSQGASKNLVLETLINNTGLSIP